MPNEEDYIFEEQKNADGTSSTFMKTPEGVLVCRSEYDPERRLIERTDFDTDGRVTSRAVYEQDGQSKPLKTSSYDARGNLIFVQKRGQTPVFYGEYQAGKPPFMCADNLPSSQSPQ